MNNDTVNNTKIIGDETIKDRLDLFYDHQTSSEKGINKKFLMMADIEEKFKDVLSQTGPSMDMSHLELVNTYLIKLKEQMLNQYGATLDIEEAFNASLVQTWLFKGIMQPPYISNHIVHSGLNTEPETQRELRCEYNDKNKIFLSLSDICRWANQLQTFEIIGTPDQKKEAEETTDSLRKILKKGMICTSTREIYANQGLSGKIIQHYGSRIITPHIIDKVIIPECPEYITIHEMLEKKVGLAYMQAITGINGPKESINETLKYIGQVKEDSILSLTPCNGDRKNDIGRAVFIYFDKGNNLIIRPHHPIFVDGISLAVEYTPPPLIKALQKR